MFMSGRRSADSNDRSYYCVVEAVPVMMVIVGAVGDQARRNSLSCPHPRGEHDEHEEYEEHDDMGAQHS